MLFAATPPASIDPIALWVLGGMGLALVWVFGRELRNVPPSLFVLMGAAFLDMVGLFMVVPLLPFYVKSLADSGERLFGLPLGLGLLTGVVVSAFTIAQMLAAPWWGRCSDRFGRRPVLMVALAASGGAFLLFGFAESLWVLVLSRLVQGAGGGTVGVIQAYVADTVAAEQRARALGWLSAATNLGVAFGPVLGSLAVWIGHHDLWPAEGTQELGRAAPGVFAAMLCAANVLFAWRFLPESRAQSPHQAAATTPGSALRTVFAHPGQPASRLLLTYGIAIGAAQGIHPTVVHFLRERHGFGEATIGYFFMYQGALSVFARILVLGPTVDRLGEARLVRVGLVTLAAGLAALPLTGSLLGLAVVVVLVPLGTALTFPCLTALLTQVVAPSERGMYMGLQHTLGGMARLSAPLLYGVVWDALGIASPFWLAAGLVATTLLFGAGFPRGAVAPTIPSR